jgi:hypothetical protein
VKVRGALIVLAVVLAARAIATLHPSPWLWGLDSLADRSLALRIVGLALFTIALIPAVGDRAIRVLGGIEARTPRRAALALAGLTGLALLWIFRSNNILLGDTQTYVSAIEKGVRSAGGAHREPLPQAILTGGYRLLGGSSGLGARDLFTAAELLLGAAFFALTAGIAARIGDRTRDRIFVFALLALGGGLQLLSGYPEYYGFAVVAALLFALAGIHRCDRGGSLLPAVLAFVLAGLCHAQMIFALPAVAFLLVSAWRRGERRNAVLMTVLLPAAAFLALLALQYPFGEIPREAARAGSLLPPIGGDTSRTAYGVFSPSHLIELLNVALLVSPALPAAVVLGLRNPDPRRERGVFLSLLAAGPILFALLANPQLGMVRDWDIFVLPATLASLWVAPHAIHALRADGGRALAGAILLSGMLHGIFWIGANHDAAASRARIRRVAQCEQLFGPQSLGEVWRYIGFAELSGGFRDRAAESYRNAIAADPDERMNYRFLAGLSIEAALGAGKGAGAGIESFHASLAGGRQRPAYTHWGGAVAAYIAGNPELAITEARAMLIVEPDHPELIATMGDLLRVGGRDLEARAFYERALARDPDQPRARIGLACLAAIRGDRAGADAELREALRRTPWAPQVQQFAQTAGRTAAGSPESFRRYFYVR